MRKKIVFFIFECDDVDVNLRSELMLIVLKVFDHVVGKSVFASEKLCKNEAISNFEVSSKLKCDKKMK